ncbi:amidohydrolase family protein [Methanobacterium spitsbergense]|uniref:Amidohydrolase family protein n=1 Tax=Methanobacterium spitsbergense TaxID=2874285 RepID=A0A8T5UXY8_9EURY|nr:amidohydrolase family protein [Methanobacterium spitsbergense]MBZ2165579.1 amidohydrolase family protein [Methanobacterium spitsbergense]
MITIKNAHVLYGENMDVRKSNIIIEDNEIVEVSEKLLKGRIIDGKGCVAAPSLINSHVHMGDSVAKDVGDGYPIDQIVKPPNGIKHRILAETSSQNIIDAMQSTIDLMFQTGTTTFVDFREGGFKGIDLLRKAAEGIPIRKIVLGRHESFYNSNNSSQLERTVEMILKSCDGIGLSGFGEIDDEVASTITEICRKESKLSSIHVAEYEELQMNSLELTGETEVERALKAGFDLLVHVTSPLNDDLKLISETGTPIVSCPRSNGSLGVGIPPLKEMLDLGISVSLGTDNLMFNSPNMFTEMEFALKITRAYYREYIPPVEVFKMATINPARALGLNIGTIEEGKLADIMLVSGLSGDPILSLINRTETQNINALIKEGNIVFER